MTRLRLNLVALVTTKMPDGVGRARLSKLMTLREDGLSSYLYNRTSNRTILKLQLAIVQWQFLAQG